MVQIIDKYGNTSTDSANVIVIDKNGIVKKLGGASGTVTNVNTSSPLTGGPISSTGTIGINQATSLADGYLSSIDWNIFNGKQNALGFTPEDVANKSTSTSLGTSNTLYPTQNATKVYADNLFEKTILRENVAYIIVQGLVNGQGGFSTSPNIAPWGLSSSGANTSSGTIAGFLRYDTTATAGTLAFRRGSFGIQLGYYNFNYTQKLRFETNLTGQRGAWGLCANYTYANPTNVEPNTNTNIVAVCQLSTSTNLQIIHNDASGLCTTIDLGVNYPCGTNIYTYYINIVRRVSLANYVVTVTRVTNSDNSEISVTHTLSTNIPVSVAFFAPICYMTNNGNAVIATYFDGGCIARLTHQ